MECEKNPQENEKHFSFSQINMFLRCPRQYFHRYVEGLKQRPAFALDFGKSVHKSLEYNYLQKVESKTDRPIEEIQSEYKKELDLSHDTIKEEVSKKEFTEWEEDYNQYRDYGNKLLDSYQKEIGKKTQPLLVEKEFNTEIAGYNFKGFMDLVDDKYIIRDTKTSASKYQQFKADIDLQLSIYAYALEKSLGIKPAGMQFDVLVKTKTPQIQIIKTQRTEADTKEALNIITATIDDIHNAEKRGYFTPCVNDQACGFCGYTQCKFNKQNHLI
jgi:RecB family exonuclease